MQIIKYFTIAFCLLSINAVAQISVDAMSKKQAASTLARLINGSENNFTTIKDSLPFFGFKENVVNYKNDGNYFFARRYYKKECLIC